MSASDDGDDSGPGTREVAHRVFAAEFDDADFDYSESDEERAPNYVVTPTGLRANRLFAVGVLTEVESINEQTLRGRVVDPTGAFVTYAGQYQPDEAAFLDRTTPPAFVALTGKARTFEPDDADVVYTSVRPESFATVDAETRDRWVVSAAEATLRRVAVFARALEFEERGDRLRTRLEAAGVPTALASGIPLAIDHYDTGTRYLEAARTLAVDALEVIADEREEVRGLDAAPADRGGAELGPLPDVPYDFDAAAATRPPEAIGDAGDDTAVADDDTGDANDVEAVGADAGDAVDADSTATDAEAVADDIEDADSAATAEDSSADTALESAEATTGDIDATATAEAETGGSAGADSESVDIAADDGLGEFDEGDDDLGDFEEQDDGPGDFDADSESTPVDGEAEPPEFDADEDAAEVDVDLDADPEEFEDAVSDEERREVEEEHGVEFATGSEVPDPGEAGMESGDVDTAATDEEPPAETTEPAREDETETADGDAVSSAEAETVDETAGDADAAAADDAADIDLEDAVVTVMTELDDGDGVDKEAVVAAGVERHGADPGDVESAIQDALMSGKCYEPSDGTLKPI